MTLQEIIKYNEEYKREIEKFELHISNLKTHLKKINSFLNLDDVKQLSYQEAKSLHKLLYYHIDDTQTRIDLETIVKDLKEKEYPQLKMAHYYPVINEMDFLNDEQKNKLDDLLRGLYNSYIYTEASTWCKLKFNKETEEKIFSFLFYKGIVEKSYVINCDCDNEEGDCNGEYISQQRYDEFVNFHKSNKDGMTWDDDHKGYIEVGCWNGEGKEIYDLDTFMREIRLYAYKCIVKPDLSLEGI